MQCFKNETDVTNVFTELNLVCVSPLLAGQQDWRAPCLQLSFCVFVLQLSVSAPYWLVNKAGLPLVFNSVSVCLSCSCLCQPPTGWSTRLACPLSSTQFLCVCLAVVCVSPLLAGQQDWPAPCLQLSFCVFVLQLSVSAPYWLVNKTGLPLVFNSVSVCLSCSCLCQPPTGWSTRLACPLSSTQFLCVCLAVVCVSPLLAGQQDWPAPCLQLSFCVFVLQLSVSAPYWLVNKTGLPLVFNSVSVCLSCSCLCQPPTGWSTRLACPLSSTQFLCVCLAVVCVSPLLAGQQDWPAPCLQLSSCVFVLQLSVSAPYWLVNKTGLPLVFKQDGCSESAAGQFEEHELARSVTPLSFCYARRDQPMLYV